MNEQSPELTVKKPERRLWDKGELRKAIAFIGITMFSQYSGEQAAIAYEGLRSVDTLPEN